LARPPESPPSENEKAVKPCALVLAPPGGVDRVIDALLGAVLDGVGPHHGAPTTGSAMAESITPTWRRTVP
jgi:hypothetical protein